MYHPEKLTTYGTQKNKQHEHICTGHNYMHTNTNTAIRPLNNNWRNRRTEHHVYAEIVTDIITRTTEYINKVTQITRSEMFGSL
jgi:hypothetical protein